MSVDDTKLHEVIALIYEAAADPDLWPNLLDQMADHVTLELALGNDTEESLSEGAGIRNVLTKHFKRATQINKKIVRLNEHLEASTSILDRLPLGVLYVESGGNVVFANQRARIVFDQDYDIAIEKERLVTSSSTVNRKIYRYIDEVLLAPETTGRTVKIGSGESDALSLLISSLDSMRMKQPEGNRYALVLIATPNAPFHVTQEVLQNRYDLSPAEARFSLALLEINSVDEAAKQLTITKHTARSHLKSIFQKTDVNKQSELIKKILISPEALIADSSRSAVAPISNDKPWYEMGKRERYIRLYDGRKLGFAEYGDPDGVPVIVHHGFPGSRLQTHPDEEISIQAGVRLIVPDRPGMGLSDFKEKRQVIDWSEDIKQLVNQLEIRRFATIGLSAGGGIYALQCASAIPDYISTVHLVSTRCVFSLMKPAPSVRPLMGMARRAPTLFYQYLKIMGESVKKNPSAYLERRMSDFSEVDRSFLKTPQGRDFYLDPLIEALRNGPKGIAWDLSLGMQDWGFSPEEVGLPVKIWHGTDDMIVPLEEAEALAGLLPNCSTSFIEGEGQFMFMSHWKNILDEIVQEHHLSE